MYEQVEKPKENKNRAIANSVAQQKSNVRQSFELVDNRPEYSRKIFANPIPFVHQRTTIQLGTGSSKMEAPDNLLLPWEGAGLVGYHGTKAWAEIQKSGEFRPGGGALGPGIYAATNIQLARMYASFGEEKTTVLDVGYFGDMDELKTKIIGKVGDYDESMEGDYDLIIVKNGVMGQYCFKLNGPTNISADNIRVREHKD